MTLHINPSGETVKVSSSKLEIATNIQAYLSDIEGDEFHRYKSWDNCFGAFSVAEKSEIQVLELAFYLASWGMYRGSGGLLQKNHLVHKGAVDILYLETSQQLKSNSSYEVSSENVDAVLEVKKQLAKHYTQDKFKFIRGTEEAKKITATDTLLSKIMLGTLGCIPAYDRYFIDGIKAMGLKHASFNSDSLNELFNFIELNKDEFIQAQKRIKDQIQTHYPLMKILDIYFWQIGYEEELKKKKTEAPS